MAQRCDCAEYLRFDLARCMHTRYTWCMNTEPVEQSTKLEGLRNWLGADLAKTFWYFGFLAHSAIGLSWSLMGAYDTSRTSFLYALVCLGVASLLDRLGPPHNRGEE